MMARAVLLITVRCLERTHEGRRMRAGEDGERHQALGMAVGDSPRHLPAPVMADEMEPRSGPAAGVGDRHDIADPAVVAIAREIARIGPRAGGVAALIRRHRAIAGPGERRELVAPCVPRLREAV